MCTDSDPERTVMMSKTDIPLVCGPTRETPLNPRVWLEKYGDYLYRFAVARVRRSDVAEDLVQETLLAAWRGRDGFDGTASERTWLTAILKRKVIDWLRRQVRERLVTDPVDPDQFEAELFTRRGEWKRSPGLWDRGQPTEALDREEFWSVLYACLRKLPVRLHDVFALRYLDETASEELCRDLGLTESNLWVTLHRARLRMWWCLSRNWFGEEPEAGGGSPPKKRSEP
jgi:RNA polymerase sigma-70 factor (ECF subfamily)